MTKWQERIWHFFRNWKIDRPRMEWMKGCVVRDGAENVGRGRPWCCVASQTILRILLLILQQDAMKDNSYISTQYGELDCVVRLTWIRDLMPVLSFINNLKNTGNQEAQKKQRMVWNIPYGPWSLSLLQLCRVFEGNFASLCSKPSLNFHHRLELDIFFGIPIYSNLFVFLLYAHHHCFELIYFSSSFTQG